MLKILFFTFLITIAQNALAINYFRCEKTEDCAKTYGGCGRYLSVHKRYNELYEAKARKSDTTSFCMPPSDKDKERNEKGVVECLKQECRLILKANKE